MQASRNLPSEAQYPYVAKPLSVSICSANTLKVSLTNNDYYNLTDAQIINLLQSGPVAISVSSDMWEYYSLGIFSCRSGVQVDHAVVIVGYTPDYWIVKNQWGTNWGLNGYIHITRNRTNNCAIGHSIHTLQGTVTSTSNDSKFIFTGSSTDADNTVNYTNGSSSSNLYNSENKIILQSFGFILFFVFMAIQ
jgi:C1A family cysteine protease